MEYIIDSILVGILSGTFTLAFIAGIILIVEIILKV